MSEPQTRREKSPNVQPTGDATKAGRKAQSAKLIESAIEALEVGDTDLAMRKARAALDIAAFSAIDAIRLAGVLRLLGDTDRAERLQSSALQGVEAAIATENPPVGLLFDCGHILMEIGREDEAEPVLRRALRETPEDVRPIFPLLNYYLRRGEPDEVIGLWTPVLKAASGAEKRTYVTSLTHGLSFFGYSDHATATLDAHEDAFAGSPEKLTQLKDELLGRNSGNQDHVASVNLFDKFAEIYDSNLKGISNNGPQMIARMILDLDWTPEPTRTILDAGCGTGLCARYLRPFSSVLHGCDLSVGMLEKSKDRNVYDLLTRTDLAERITFPQGTFDVVVCADVLVYFGDLAPALTNMAASAKPGGWLLFTVEDAPNEPSQGWEFYSSGRYRHCLPYLERELIKAGFTKPKKVFRDTLRYEFGMPINAICVATQKLALAF